MALIYGTHMVRARSSTYRQPQSHELRVVRSLAPGQPKLETAVERLDVLTGNMVRYKPVERMGATLVMLDPLIRKVLNVERGHAVPKERLRWLERDLNTHVAHARYKDYDIPLEDPLNPLRLYGRRRWLGIPLSPRDYRMYAERAVVEQYFIDRHELSRRAVTRALVRLEPHVTVGEVLYPNLESDQKRSLHADASGFILGAALQRQEDQVRIGERTDSPEPIVFPETITLNGLRIACQPKGS